MDLDFSHLNLEYLIRARDLARDDPELAALVLDLPPHLAAALSAIDAAALPRAGDISLPLVAPRGTMHWWHRFIQALRENDPAEIEAVISQLGLWVGNEAQEDG